MGVDIVSVDDFLRHAELGHLSSMLKGVELEELACEVLASRPKALQKLKDLGVCQLPDRQQFASQLSKAMRDGVVPPPKRSGLPPPPKVADPLAMPPDLAHVKAGQVQKFDDSFDLADVLINGVAVEDPTKKVTFKKYDDGMTATALVDSLADQMKAKLAELASIGVKTAPPRDTKAVIVGAGLAGMAVAIEMIDSGALPAKDMALLERSHSAGGVWCHQANSYSRVNSSEPSYRLARRDRVPSRNDTPTNHTPSHQIVDEMIVLLRDYALASQLFVYCNVETVLARKDGRKGWHVTGRNQSGPFEMDCELAALATNRRLGTPRDITYKGEADFAGSIARGLNSDAEALTWATRCLIIGMGAFALEHMRTALERGAPYCSILCRRRGAVCPQVIDWVNFIRPVQHDFTKEAGGSGLVHGLWAKAYKMSGATVRARAPTARACGVSVSVNVNMNAPPQHEVAVWVCPRCVWRSAGMSATP